MMTELDRAIIKEIIIIYEINHTVQKELTITKHEQGKKSSFRKKYPHTAFADSKPVQAWEYQDSNLKEINLDKKNPNRSDIRYDTYLYATSRFIYQEKEKGVYLDIIFGPMCGRGWYFPIVKKDDKLVLEAPRVVWKS